MPLVRPPTVYVLGGPNGAGKTTFAREFLPSAEVIEFLNADLLAAGLSPLRPEAMAILAARLLLNRWRELVAARVSFAFESTLSGRTYATMLHEATSAGYSVQICYLWLPDAKFSLDRFVSGYVKVVTRCRPPTCAAASCRVSVTFSISTYLLPTPPCFSRRPPIRHGWLLLGKGIIV